MRKVLVFLMITALMVVSFASMAVFAANDPIVFDFSEKVEPKVIATDEANGDNWVITFSNGVSFMGKKSKARISYEYVDADKAAKFTAHKDGANIDPYFISSDADGNDVDLPAAYQIDTSVYKYMKISYKANSAASKGLILLMNGNAAYDLSNCVDYTMNIDGEWHSDVVDYSANEFWTNKITRFRINVFEGNTAAEGDSVEIAYIAFFATEEEAAAFDPSAQTPSEGEGQTPSEGEGQTPSEGEGQTPSEGEGQTPSEGNKPDVPNTNTGDAMIIASIAAVLALAAVAVVIRKRVTE